MGKKHLAQLAQKLYEWRLRISVLLQFGLKSWTFYAGYFSEAKEDYMKRTRMETSLSSSIFLHRRNISVHAPHSNFVS